jgi:hypothetical protein
MTCSVTCMYLSTCNSTDLDYRENWNFGAQDKYRYPLTTSELIAFLGEQSGHVDWMKQILATRPVLSVGPLSKIIGLYAL